MLLHQIVRRIEHGVVLGVRDGWQWQAAPADGLVALLGERVAEGPVRDEAVPPACNAVQQRKPSSEEMQHEKEGQEKR